MMVEMDQPFVWPAEPESLDPYVPHCSYIVVGVNGVQSMATLTLDAGGTRRLLTPRKRRESMLRLQ